MASNQNNEQLNLCKEIFHGSGTSFIIPIDNIIRNTSAQQLKTMPFCQNISLTQVPCETLTLKLTTTQDYHSIRTLSLQLYFDNNLHEIRQDYVYIIKLQVLMQYDSNYKYHVDVFSHEEKRSKNVISIYKESESLENLNELLVDAHHLCCRISRFNTARKLASEASFSSNIGKMLLKHGSDYSDTSLVVGDKIFSVHKLVLQSKSDVFKAMFTNDMSEAKTGIVKIDDMDAEVIEELLNYIYTGKTEKMSELSQELFIVANKYAIFDLREKCEEYFTFNLNCENAVGILDLATVYELESLRSSVAAFITKHEEDIVKTKTYQDFLCRDLTADRIVSILTLCAKYNLGDVKLKAFKVVQENKETFAVDQAFLDLLGSNPDLSKSFISWLLLSNK